MMDTKYAPRSTETRTVVDGVEYIVRSFYKEDARETVEQKLLRLVKECVAAEIKNPEDAVFRSK